MSEAHRYIAFGVVAVFTALWVWGAVARALKRRDAGSGFWVLLAIAQVIAAVQAVVGLILLLTGRLLPDVLHLVYGFGPIVVLGGAHLYARRIPDERYPYQPFLIAAFVAWGLSGRALMTGLGVG